MQPSPDRPTSPLAVLLVGLLAAAVVGVSAIVVTSPPGGAVAAATGLPAAAPAASATAPAGPATRPPGAARSPAVGGLPAAPTAASASPPPSAASPSAAPVAAPTPKPVLAMNLYRKGDFVGQATKDQCVAAAMQIMLNVVGPRDDRSKRTQAELARLATSLSEARDRGTEPLGWARGLEERGAGRYEVAVAPTRGKAIERAVRAIRATGRPVGLLVWRGAHSWVLHGFETTADPAGPTPMTVTRLYVSDPWYPRVSSIWGESRGPNAAITPAQLAEDYLPWRRPTGRYPGMDGQFVMILPVAG